MKKFSKQTITWLLLAGLIQSSTGFTALAEEAVTASQSVAQEVAPSETEESQPEGSVEETSEIVSTAESTSETDDADSTAETAETAAVTAEAADTTEAPVTEETVQSTEASETAESAETAETSDTVETAEITDAENDITVDYEVTTTADDATADIKGVFNADTGVLTISGTGKVTTASASQWSSYRNSIKSVVIEDGITEIGNNLFQNYSSITKVSLPDSLTRIGDLAFSGCTKLVSVSVPAVTYFGEQAFRGCTSLTSATIADGVIFIPDYCFAGCTSLKSVAIPSDTLTSFGKHAFDNCITLERLNYTTKDSVEENTAGLFDIPEGVTNIDDFAFSGCAGIKSLIVPKTVIYIGGSAFLTATNLKEVSIADGDAPLMINACAFQELTNLTTVTLNRVKYLGEGAFAKTGIARISLPATIEEIDKGCFQASALEELTFIPSHVKINTKAFADCSKLKTIDMMVESGVGVYDIGESAFANCTALTELTVPASITQMGKLAFSGCTSLSSVTIDNGAQYIGIQAFHGDPIEEIAIPASVTTMASAFKSHATLKKAVINCATVSSSTFSGCPVLSDVTFGDGVQTVGSSAFSSCPSLKAVNLNKIIALNDSAFNGCAALTAVTGTALRTISTNCFSGCTALTDLNGKNMIKLPDSLTGLNGGAFNKCTSINNVYLPEEITSIKENTFNGCTSLSHIEYSDNITYIGKTAFSNCTALREFNMPTSLVSIDSSAFSGCTLLESVKMNQSLKTIGSSAFSGCTSLKTADIPEGSKLTDIGSSAFAGDLVLNNISLPSGVVKINDSVFKGCAALSDITVASADDGTLTSIGASAFNGCKLLKGFNIPASVTIIGSSAFNGCAALDVKIEKPSTDVSKVTWGSSAFADCASLGKTYDIECPDQLTTISDGLFKNCVSLKIPSNFIPSNVTSIGSSAFSGCTSTEFTGIIIPEKVKSIGASAFEGCTNITAVDFYTTVLTTIGSQAFAECGRIRDIVVPVSVTSLGTGVFRDCASLKSVTLAGTMITSIPEQAFMNCAALPTIEIPGGYYNTSGVFTPFKAIGKSAFAGCTKLGSTRVNGQNTIIIPNTVTSIGQSAFESCTSLKYIVIPVNAAPGNSSFANCTSLETAIVLSNSKSISAPFSGCTKLKIFCYPSANYVINYAKNNGFDYELLAGSNGTYIAILKHPETWTSAKIGGKAVFVANAVSDGALHYTWYTKKQSDKNYIESQTTGDTLTVDITEDTEGMAVYCLITETKNEASTEIINTASTNIAYVTAMTAPVISSVTSTGNISWNKITGADEYHVYRADSEDGKRTELTVINDASVTSYTDSTAIDGKTYFYFVSAVSNTTGVTITSAPKSVTIDKVPGITNITSAEPGDGTVTLTWETIKEASRYRIQRLFGSEWRTIATVKETTYTDKGLTNGTAYSYRIICSVNNVWKTPSKAVKVTPAAPSVTPTNVTAVANEDSITLTWGKAAGATKYRIRRSDGKSWVTLATVTGTTYTDTTALDNVSYSYVIYAYTDGTFKNPSEAVSAKIISYTMPILTVSAQENNVTVSWNAVKGATKYRLRRNDGKGWTTMQTSAKTSFVDTTAETGKRYTYVVYPYVDNKFGDPSTTVKVALVGQKASANITVFTADGQAKISWEKIDGVKKYRVRRNDGTKWQTMASTANLSWTDTSIVKGKTYTYVVYTSTDGTNYSVVSSTVTSRP